MKELTTINYTPQKSYMIPKHSHHAWEFVCYIQGNGILTVGDTDYPFKPGDIICQPPHIEHSEVSDDGFQNIYLTVKDYYYPSNEVHRFEDNDSKDVYTLLSMIYRIYHLKHENYQHIVSQLLEVFRLFIEAKVSSHNKNQYVKQLEEVLINNISNGNFNLKATMDAFPICNDHLRRLFKKYNSITPSDYLLNKRIDQAKSLLENKSSSGQQVKLIASLVGFDDPYYFSKIFKSKTGVSPSMWKSKAINGSYI